MENTQSEILRQSGGKHLNITVILLRECLLIEVRIVFNIFYSGFQVGLPMLDVQLAFQACAELFVHIVIIPVEVFRMIMTHIKCRKGITD